MTRKKIDKVAAILHLQDVSQFIASLMPACNPPLIKVLPFLKHEKHKDKPGY